MVDDVTTATDQVDSPEVDEAAAPAATETKTDGLAGTVLDEAGKKAGASEDAKPGSWPDDWRERFAGTDEKLKTRLARFKEPNDVLKSWLNAEKKISEKTPSLKHPGAEATEEQIKAWREAAGVPEKPEEYDLKLSNGRQIGDEDKPIIDELKGVAHKLGVNNEQASGLVDWYYQTIEQEAQELNVSDEDYRDRTVTALREDWGPGEFKRNMGAVMQLFEGADEKIVVDDESGDTMDMKVALLGARMPNGRKVGGDPNALRFLTRLGLELMPLDKEIPAGETSGSVEGRLEEIRRIRRNEPDKYEQNRAAYEAEELKLIEAKQRRDKRDQAA